jgi:hypothetical protein
VQFDALLEDGLYADISRRADGQAIRIKAAALEKGYALYADSPTNQQFLVMPDAAIEKLARDYAFAYIGAPTSHIPWCGSARAGRPGRGRGRTDARHFASVISIHEVNGMRIRTIGPISMQATVMRDHSME